MSYDPKAEYGFCVPFVGDFKNFHPQDTDEVIKHVLLRRMEKLLPNGTKWEVIVRERPKGLCAYRFPEMDDPDYAWPDTWRRKRGEEEFTFVRSMMMETSRLEDGTDVA